MKETIRITGINVVGYLLTMWIFFIIRSLVIGDFYINSIWLLMSVFTLYVWTFEFRGTEE